MNVFSPAYTTPPTMHALINSTVLASVACAFTLREHVPQARHLQTIVRLGEAGLVSGWPSPFAHYSIGDSCRQAIGVPPAVLGNGHLEQTQSGPRPRTWTRG